MALVIEDGTLVAGANSFVPRSEIISYAALRGVTLVDDATTDILAIKAMDYLWSLCYKGDKVSATQTTPFPRSGLVAGDTADDFVHEIPYGIQIAQMQLALDAHAGIDLTPSANPSAVLKRTKVGPIEREFFAPSASTLDGDPPLTLAGAWLAPFICLDGAFSLCTVRV